MPFVAKTGDIAEPRGLNYHPGLVRRISARICLLLLVLISTSEGVPGQEPPQAAPDRGAASTAALSVASAQEERPVSWKLLLPNIVHDQEPIWLFPTQVARGQHVKLTLGFFLATAGMVALDPHDTPYFRRTDAFHDFNRVLSGKNTVLGTAIVPLSFYAVGLARRDSYAQQTALLAGQAVADVQILTLVMKNIDRRLRPADIPVDGDYSHTWFKSHGRVITGRGSFPSGHAVGAFAVATVFAERYRRHRWVPWVAYGLASLVGFSRVSLQSHFPSDVFAGAVLGYTISHYVVLRRP